MEIKTLFLDQRGFSVIVEELANEFLEPNDTRLLLNTVVKGTVYRLL